MSALPQPQPLTRSLLEGNFPFDVVSRIARADRFNRDGVYAAHKWWARRPPGVIRALLLASCLPADTTAAQFWEHYRADTPALAGWHVGDPFMGGATTLVEAGRLGADVTGIDVDPLAVLIASEELTEIGDLQAFEQAAAALLAYLTECCGELYGMSEDPSPAPLHYFYLRRVTCDSCQTDSLMYRSPVLARDVGKSGAVVRERGYEVFCPDCRQLRHLPHGRKGFRCCGRLHRLDRGTYSRAGHTCPGCRSKRTHQQLATGRLPRELIAVEETVTGAKRRFRAPAPPDLAQLQQAQATVADLADRLPTASLEGIDSGRARLYGFETVADLFNPRQQLVFASAFNWLDGQEDLPPATVSRLRLAMSNALSSNNTLCGYATDYGRLAPLFNGVRSYAMPVLSVELNPLHPSSGRGTLTATLRRMRQSLQEQTRRHVIDADGQVKQQEFQARRTNSHHVVCQSADRRFPDKQGRCDVIVTDPPYFDFIAYSDLSLLYRAWLWPDDQDGSLGGRPIYPVGQDPVKDFGTRLGRALRTAAASLVAGGTMTFTFHSTNPDAWDALSAALRKAKLRVTALFPVWTDARAAAHAHPGNCEWDVVFICRPASEAPVPALEATVEGWLARLGPDAPRGNDLANLKLGLQAALDANTEESREQGRADGGAEGQTCRRGAD
jgi:putative DNA methylase